MLRGQAGIPPDIEMNNDFARGKFTPSHEKNKEKPMRLFRNEDPGPFLVNVESLNKEKTGISRVHPMALGKLLHSKFPEITKNIESIKKVGLNRIRIEFSNATSANNLILCALKDSGFNMFIPQYLLQRRGVIRGVDTELSLDEIKEIIRGPNGVDLEITELRRLNRKIKDSDGDGTRLIPTQSVLMTVRGQVLPQYVYIHHVCCEVNTYIQSVIQCKRCCRFGHFQDQCKGSEKCETCGGSHESKTCRSVEKKCANCGSGGHAASNRALCPSFRKEKLIKQMMAMNNTSYFDAKSAFNGNSFAALTSANVPQLDDMKEFPLLNINNVNSNRPFASTVSFKRTTKRNRIQSPPHFDVKQIQNQLYDQPMGKNLPGGLVTHNPYRPSGAKITPNCEEKSTTNRADLISTNSDVIYETVYSLLKNMNLSQIKDWNDERVKIMIKDRIKNLKDNS